MNVIFISESSGKAAITTRKILDRFCTRIGSNSWEAAISEEGLGTVHALIRQKHSRQMSVSCHRITHHGRRSLMWIVGDRERFSPTGQVATGWTGRHLPVGDSTAAPSVRLLSVVVELAGLLHDLGKGLVAFQEMIRGGLAEAARHEWLSGEVLLSMIDAPEIKDIQSESAWIDSLMACLASENLTAVLNDRLKKRKPLCVNTVVLDAGTQQRLSVFSALWWLIVSHHRLPEGTASISQATLVSGLTHLRVGEDVGPWRDCRKFSHKGQPWESDAWMLRASEALKALATLVSDMQSPSLDNDCVRLFGRLALLLADQSVSSGAIPCGVSDSKSQDVAYANTVRMADMQSFGQLLPRHLLDVARKGSRAVDWLPRLRRQLPSIESSALPPMFRKASPARFAWQDDAVRLLRTRAKDIEKGAFFGVLVAGTGTGKTVAAPKLLAAISGKGVRFTYTSPTRILTLQAWDKLRSQGFAEDQCAAIIGDSTVFELYQNSKEQESGAAVDLEGVELSVAGGKSSVPDDFETRYPLVKHLNQRERTILCAPVLSTTLDTLMKMADTRRSGYVLHGLRLLSADLIVDEVAAYSPVDLMALGRLMEVAGFWRVNVIICSATMAPAIAKGLYGAWHVGLGRRAAMDGLALPAYAGWFSDAAPGVCRQINDVAAFENHHRQFVVTISVQQRLAPVIRSIGYVGGNGDLARVPGFISGASKVEVSEGLLHGIEHLHRTHAVDVGNGKRLSVGCVQLVNVKDCQKVTKGLTRVKIAGLTVKVVCLHARLSLAVRTMIESRLDRMLLRQDGDAVPLIDPDVADAVRAAKSDVVVIVVSTMESTGRDHDYDWGILETRDFGTIGQFAGRIRRHRPQGLPGNLLVLDRPLRCWQSEKTEGGAFMFYGVNDPVGKGDTRLPVGGVSNKRRMSEMLHDRFRHDDGGYLVVDNESAIGESGLVATDVFSVERERLEQALLAKSTGNAPLSVAEWIAVPTPLIRMSSWHASVFRFRESRGEEALVWRESDGWKARMSNNDGRCPTSWEAPVAVQVNENGLLFSVVEDNLVTTLGEQLGLAPGCRAERLGCVRIIRPNEKGWGYHWALGMVAPEK